MLNRKLASGAGRR